MFNTMAKPKGQPEETSKEGLSVGGKVMIWEHGNLPPNKNGDKKGRKKGKINIAKMGPRRSLALPRRKRRAGMVLEHMSKIDPYDVEEGKGQKSKKIESENGRRNGPYE